MRKSAFLLMVLAMALFAAPSFAQDNSAALAVIETHIEIVLQDMDDLQALIHSRHVRPAIKRQAQTQYLVCEGRFLELERLKFELQ